MNRVFPHKTQISRWNHSAVPLPSLVQIESAQDHDYADTLKKN